ncbi:hypothetical protein [Kitasatospora brasiliensis]|uniref:hypothetical protein n=1 Tax=Kitasatospora brasiliensis TaxID=3058040 RepID=UPI00292CC84E|nr:hypothetical protein [Kitasatospora sp. K002]
MTAPIPGEPFADALAEAAQTSTMAIRLILAVADVVRRAAQRKASGAEEPLPPADQAVPEAAGELKAVLAADIAMALMAGADWPVMARQIVALRRAGVDLDEFLPRVGEIALSVRDAVAANAVKIAAAGAEEWAGLLRETMPAGPVREAILASPAWPDIAASMKALQERGVDVRTVLLAAHAEGVGVDQAVARVMAKSKDKTAEPRTVPSPSRDVVRAYGPLTVGLDLPKDLDLRDRERALAQLGVSRAENERYVRWVRDAMPGKEHEAGLLVASHQWPLLAAEMARMEDQGRSVTEHLSRLMRDRSWDVGQAGLLRSRLLQAACAALKLPTYSELRQTSVVTAAAKAGSAPGPTRSRVKGTAPAGPTATPHRAPTTPAAVRKR